MLVLVQTLIHKTFKFYKESSKRIEDETEDEKDRKVEDKKC